MSLEPCHKPDIHPSALEAVCISDRTLADAAEFHAEARAILWAGIVRVAARSLSAAIALLSRTRSPLWGKS